MKVGQLIEELKKINPEKVVVLSGDSEGNDYREMSEIEWENIVFNEEESEVGFEYLSEELKDEGYDEEDIIEGEKAIVFY